MKRKTLTFSRIISGLLVLLMSFALIVPTFAEDATIGTPTTNPALYSPKATITVGKTLETNSQGIFPNVTFFEFLLEPVDYTAGPDAASLDDPDSGYINYTETDIPIPMPATTDDYLVLLRPETNTAIIRVSGFDPESTENSQTKTLTTPEITYTQSGIYTYKLTEIMHNTPIPGMEYDESINYINVYVTNVLNTDGTPVIGENGLPVVTVSAITGWKAQNPTVLDMQKPDNAGKPADDTTTNGKSTIVIPEPNDDNVRNIEYPFKNIYNTKSLTVTKTVTGDLADPHKEFTFTINFKVPGSTIETDTRTFNYDIYNEGNTTAISTDSLQDSGTFKLKHNQYIVITGLPVGETVTVTESDYSTAGYTTTNSAPIDNSLTGAGARTAQITIGDANIIDFINNKQSTPPTGIMLDVVPFVMIVVVAGLGIMTITKKRKVEER